MTRILLLLLLLVALGFGARALALAGRRRFERTLLGQVLAALRSARETPQRRGSEPAVSALVRCERCGEHVPAERSGNRRPFVCNRCREQS